MYHTLANDKITFNAIGKRQGTEKWKANNADVIISLADGVNSEIVVTKDVILPRPEAGILDVLKKNKDTSIFYNMLMRSGMENVFKKTTIKKICFTRDTCVSLTSTMVRHLTDAIKFNQFTVIVPTNDMLRRMNDITVKDLLSNENDLKEFLQGYVFLGSVGNPDAVKEIGYSLSPKHSVMTTSVAKGETILTDSEGKEVKVKSRVRVKEGTVVVVEQA